MRGVSRVLALLSAVSLLLAPAIASGDIYKWTDERGNTVVSNVQPVNPSRVGDIELLAVETKPAARPSVAPSQKAATPQPATPAEQALQERIENLERQLQAQQYAQPPQVVPQLPYPGGYYPTPAPPPPDPSYYASYDPGYYPGYYYPGPPIYSFVVVPALVRRPVHRPQHAHRPVSVHRPAFVNRPVIASRPVIVSRPATAFTQRATFSGGSMRGARR